MRIRLKIQHDPTWRPDTRYWVRYWVYLPDGRYFPIFSGLNGFWFQLCRPHQNYHNAEEAIADNLRYLFAKVDKTAPWRSCRAKEQFFKFNDQSHSQLRLPPKRSKPKM
jgi:hypothetical protein